ncbi:hypothetical protein HWV62_28144 [Athelia sp. TMB]|nr:hypothetical protein HWV62_28144 [Athelia sp. TMB]
MLTFFLALLAAGITVASPTPENAHLGKNCTATISSPSIEAFTMTEGVTLDLTGLVSGTTVNLRGDVSFAVSYWAGPLLKIGAASHVLDGLGASYWDGLGGGGGVTKPAPMINIGSGGGRFSNVTIRNSPMRAIAVSNSAPMKLSAVIVDNSEGAALGHNTDCFDVAASNLTITRSTCVNQDDCLAINRGSGIIFSKNVSIISSRNCVRGNLIFSRTLLPSIAPEDTASPSARSRPGDRGGLVSDVTIADNTIENSVNGLRIKTDTTATGGSGMRFPHINIKTRSESVQFLV